MTHVSNISGGVDRSIRIRRAKMGAIIDIVIAKIVLIVIDVPIVCEMSVLLFAPKNCETIMSAPIDNPIQTIKIKENICMVLPMTANASSPTKRLTMIVSNDAKTCADKSPIIIGTANKRSFFHDKPSVKSVGKNNLAKRCILILFLNRKIYKFKRKILYIQNKRYSYDR